MHGGGQKAESDADSMSADQAEIDSFDPDQLARYWRGLHSCAAEVGEPVAVVYLTSHLLPPRKQLDDSLSRETFPLLWLSWFDVWRVAASAHKTAPELLAARDLKDLLRHRHFALFDGFSRDAEFDVPEPRGFLEQAPWFSQASWSHDSDSHFWEQR